MRIKNPTRSASTLLPCGVLLCCLVLQSTPVWGGGREVHAPLVCSIGPRGQTFRASVSVPLSLPTGSRLVVRIDGFSSGKISHFGLNYLFDMQTDYRIPPGARYVEGSVRIVPNTGTANATSDARVWHDESGVHLLLPARVKNGSSYTPPSIEFQLIVTTEAGTELQVKLERFRVAVKVAVLGTVRVHCVPEPSPYVIGKTSVVAQGLRE